MSEELIQRNLLAAPEHMGAWKYYNIGATTLKALKEAQIIPQKDYAAYESKKPDALIIDKQRVIAVIEYKQPRQLRTKKQIAAAIAQERGTARALGAAIYIVTDGKKTLWINPLTGNPIRSEDGEPICVVFERTSDVCIRLMHRILSSIHQESDQLRVSSPVDPLPLARQIWQDLWAVSGATPENCLYTFVEVFIFKYLSDLGVLWGMYTFDRLIACYEDNSDNDVLEMYAGTIRPKIKELFPWNPEDKTTIINGTIFVSKDDKAVDGYAAVFHKILDRFAKFGTLEKIDYDFKSRLFETFLKESISKKNWGQFFTPLRVVQSIAKMAEIRPGMHICDPACGVGKFLLEPILHDIDRYFTVEDGQLKSHIYLSGFDKGFDKDEQKTIILAKANMLIYFSALLCEHAGISAQFSELFNKTFLLQTNSILGTLARPVTDTYDLILTNPPYVMSGSSNLKEEIAKRADLKSHYSISAMGVEGLFMEWIIRALKPGGKAFIVVPDGIMNRSNDQRLRDFIRAECAIDAVISLPLNTFFTTNKKTYILALTKKVPVVREGVTVKERQTDPVFTYLCSEIGETRDMYRFDLEQNDLAAAADLYCMFRGAKDCFRTDDPRCKIVPIDAFEEGAHWSVERWWTREERIALGIEEEKESVSIEEFVLLVEDTTETLNEFRELLREVVKKKFQVNQRKEICLSDRKYFDLFIGKRVLRKDFQIPRGEIPVYSANVFKPFVYSDTSNITDYDSSYVIWGIDGNFDFNVVGMGTPFATTDHCGAIKIIHHGIDPFYLSHILRESSYIYGFDRGLRASLTNMKNVKIHIPVSADGEFDIEYQNFITHQLVSVKQIKDEIVKKRNRIEAVIFHIDLKEYSMVYYPLPDLFTIVRGSGLYTKTYLREHPGVYPVYSGNTCGAFASTDRYDYDTPCLTWAIDGLAGYMMVHQKPFSATNHRGILLPKRDDINIDYIKFVLEPLLRRAKKGRIGDRGANEYTSLPPFMLKDISIPLPVDADGQIRMDVQQEIADIYTGVEEYRHAILMQLDTLLHQRISY